MRAFLDWFDKYPEYKEHELYITGESYAGVYVPYMALEMDKHNNATKSGDFKFNLKGIVVGNGVTNWKWDGDQAYITGGFPRGLSSIDLYHAEKNEGCNFYYEDNEPDYSPACLPYANKFYQDTNSINVYDIYRTCWTVNDTSVDEDLLYGYVEIDGETKKYRKRYSTRDRTPWIYDEKNNHPMLKSGDCTWDSPITEFMNKQSTRDALHIPSKVQAW